MPLLCEKGVLAVSYCLETWHLTKDIKRTEVHRGMERKMPSVTWRYEASNIREKNIFLLLLSRKEKWPRADDDIRLCQSRQRIRSRYAFHITKENTVSATRKAKLFFPFYP